MRLRDARENFIPPDMEEEEGLREVEGGVGTRFRGGDSSRLRRDTGDVAEAD
eukprot:CAMPEP_0114470694 /NCGR_PEP_ID=MMETSP0104-20121206/11406_1 /TAXON_ID=37642 ORGANISM="Paraphysomonas imperforata, Strain PA2" /NCGR_SAMPLE_ID=MMETSP0104 /ASSEMBLY_ACC=CAM_ASM_000202 /LENGTH=51 /DNA_ID=CAMNT_0001644471 /DNA_START=980 /DNA_END=1135 /DNA_ORIENTATION=+